LQGIVVIAKIIENINYQNLKKITEFL